MKASILWSFCRELLQWESVYDKIDLKCKYTCNITDPLFRINPAQES